MTCSVFCFYNIILRQFFLYFMGLRGISAFQMGVPGGVPGSTDTLAQLVSFGHFVRLLTESSCFPYKTYYHC